MTHAADTRIFSVIAKTAHTARDTMSQQQIDARLPQQSFIRTAQRPLGNE